MIQSKPKTLTWVYTIVTPGYLPYNSCVVYGECTLSVVNEPF